MKEIGGYIELDTYNMNMLHDDGIKLNCGRNALAYIIKSRKIKKIYVPKYMCDSNDLIYEKYGVAVYYYPISRDFKPILDGIEKMDWTYIINYYGQLSNEYLGSLKRNIIVDNAQAYFQSPIEGIDTLYTSRKFFGVPDGAILYCNKLLDEKLQIDESRDRMHFLLGRYERTANEFYDEYVQNNELFINEPIKRMSKLTENLLHAIDYDMIKKIRTRNFEFLHNQLKNVNQLNLNVPEGAFMYPLYIDDGDNIRRKLQAMKIYVPLLWPTVLKMCSEQEIEYQFAKNILPLPCDQRYSIDDMCYMVDCVLKLL